MNMNKFSSTYRHCHCLLLAILILPFSMAWADDVKTLEWDDLIPHKAIAEFKKQQNIPIDHSGGAAEPQMSAFLSAVNAELDGQLVKLPGFMVPLGGDENKITEFLLVPYFGACMHTPPPPTNQIVYVNYSKGVHPDMLYEPVWIEGPLHVGEVESELAVSGYSMEPRLVIQYREAE